jgi:hypothetical protein
MVREILHEMDLSKTRKLTRVSFGMRWNGFATRYFKIREDGPLECAIM